MKTTVRTGLPKRALARKRALVCALGLLGSVAFASPATGEVNVQFIEPQRYTDIGFSKVDQRRNLRTLEEHMQGWQQRLPAGQRLDIEVLDVDLAGMERPWGREPFVRVLTGRIDGPRIHFRWNLSESGRSLSAGEEQLSDMAYAQRLPIGFRNEPLYYDRRLLDQWWRSVVSERVAKSTGG